jgi:hypothetical protein
MMNLLLCTPTKISFFVHLAAYPRPVLNQRPARVYLKYLYLGTYSGKSGAELQAHPA